LLSAALLAPVVVVAALASGERAASAETRSEKASADQRARELFISGDRAYAEARYEEALADFQKAYDLSGRPQLLFNLANAYERLGRYGDAADALDQYLASGKAKDKETVQARLANLRKRVEDQKKEEERAAREREEKEKREAAAAEEARRKDAGDHAGGGEAPGAGRPSRVLPWALVGGGGALVVTGSIFGVLALGAHGDASSGCTDAPAGHLCSADARSALDREKTFAVVADVGVIAGLALAGVGAYFLLAPSSGAASAASATGATSAKRAHEAALPRLRVSGRPGGGGIDLVGRF
jgi:tetratricopeptide (TPR) repeat protein